MMYPISGVGAIFEKIKLAFCFNLLTINFTFKIEVVVFWVDITCITNPYGAAPMIGLGEALFSLGILSGNVVL